MKRTRESRKSKPSRSGRPREAKFRFKKQDKDRLAAVLRDGLGVSPKAKAVGAFQRAAELAIDGFDLYREIERQRPGARSVEMPIKQFKEYASELKRAMDSMSSDTRYHLELCLQAPMFHLADAPPAKNRPRKKSTLAVLETSRAARLVAQAFMDRFAKELASLEIAAAVAATAPQHTGSGRPKEHWRLELASEIAHAFADCFKVDPAATREGETAEQSPFAAVLGICLDAAGVYVKDRDRLAADAVARTKALAPRPD